MGIIYGVIRKIIPEKKEEPEIILKEIKL